MRQPSKSLRLESKNPEGMCVGVVDVLLTYLAGLSLPLRRAHALEAVLQVHAGPTLSARAGRALVQI